MLTRVSFDTQELRWILLAALLALPAAILVNLLLFNTRLGRGAGLQADWSEIAETAWWSLLGVGTAALLELLAAAELEQEPLPPLEAEPEADPETEDAAREQEPDPAAPYIITRKEAH